MITKWNLFNQYLSVIFESCESRFKASAEKKIFISFMTRFKILNATSVITKIPQCNLNPEKFVDSSRQDKRFECNKCDHQVSSFNQDLWNCEISRFEASAEKKLWNQNQNVHKCQVKILDLNATNWRLFSHDPSVRFKSCEIKCNKCYDQVITFQFQILQWIFKPDKFVDSSCQDLRFKRKKCDHQVTSFQSKSLWIFWFRVLNFFSKNLYK